MATLITSDCINCGACEPECPNTAIYQGGVDWELGDATSPAISEDIFYIVPQKCTECVGFYEQEACAAVCPVDCCIPDPDIPETEDVLIARAKELHPDQSFEGDFPSRFKVGGEEAPAEPAESAEAPAPQANGAAEPTPVAAPAPAAPATAPATVAPKPVAVPVPKRELRERLFPGELAESYEAALSRIAPARANIGLGSVVALLQPLLGALPASTKNSLEEALEHIEYYGSGHTEAIITRDDESSQQFQRDVDAAAGIVNASSRFTDGGQLGLGAEVGISTQKFHARGPLGLRELTSYKWVIIGEGQIRE